MRWITSPGWPGNLLAVVAGALTTLALAPYDIWPLALVALALFYLGLRDLSPRQALGRGWCFGFGLFGAGTSWIYYSIHNFGGASVLLAGLLMLAFTAAIAWFFALPAWLWARWIRRNEAPLADALAFAALWVMQEAFRGWFLTGFPWLYSGYSQLDGPLAGLAPLGGMWLISFTLALTATVILMPGITVTGLTWWTFLLIGVLFALLSEFLRPALLFLTGRLLIRSLGLFLVVIDATILWLITVIGPGEWHLSYGVITLLFAGAILAIVSALLDIVFSLDSVITAVGMAQHIMVMVIAVVIAVIFMMIFSGSVSAFISKHPTVKMLALSFLLLIGTALIGEGMHFHIPKGYVYFAMAFSVFVEMLNLRMKKKSVAEAESP